MRLFYFCPGYQSGVNYSTGAADCVGSHVAIAEHQCKELCPVDTHWTCFAVLIQKNTNVQLKWRLNCLTVDIKWRNLAIWIETVLTVRILVKTACHVATVV
jgi:hypothetical protein